MSLSSRTAGPLAGLAIALALVAASGAPLAAPAHRAPGTSEAAASPALQTALADYQQSNFPVALREFATLARHGNRIAAFDYAMMLLNGEGTPPDIPGALIWLRKAAQANMSHAQFTYGRLYDDGQVVPRDTALAHRWFLKAAAQGHVDAQVALATQYMDGRGTPRNYARAFGWYLKAAKNGDEASQYIVASFYEKGGDGVAVDLTSARLWYALAAAQGGDPAARLKFDEVSARLRAAPGAAPPARPARGGADLQVIPSAPDDAQAS
ncbi:tetratricopeptide repeat protein [Robbsia sp. Bb-Pol-6]|uniref:Tetratricopeptide repeat protein n=1 Tax=Robbsia betulipollinis TaxID=2981849 RepID=A0ABT3ZI35_9BURK|nr:tetratricopeptide repeat protein [Robbsia betulipollinis]MCY0386176.1 tetratricopeptide repeat protein [Robbsia betulipollinis]